MPTLCSKEPGKCPGICDACKHFDFNGDEGGFYTGDGWCRLHERGTDPELGCTWFHCFNVRE